MTCKCPSDMHHAINCPEYKLPPHLTDRLAAREKPDARPGEPSVNPREFTAPAFRHNIPGPDSAIPPHLAHRIEQIKARATEMGMDPGRFDDLLTATAEATRRVAETTRRFQNTPSTSQEPFYAPNPTPDARQVATTLATVCATFIVGAYIGRRFSR